MSYSNGLLSDQSYQTANKYVQRGLPGVGFKLTDTGDYDMQNKKTCPMLMKVKRITNDVVNKHQLDVGLQTKPNNFMIHVLVMSSMMEAVTYGRYRRSIHVEGLYIEDPFCRWRK